MGEPHHQVHNDGHTMTMRYLKFVERAADPDDPPDGQAIIWMSNGTESGNDGDIMIKITAGGETNIGTLAFNILPL